MALSPVIYQINLHFVFPLNNPRFYRNENFFIETVSFAEDRYGKELYTKIAQYSFI